MSGKGSSRKPSPIDTNRPKEDGYLDPSGYAENGYENGKTADTIYPKSPHFFDFPTKFKRKTIVGVCAMDQKARSRAMQNILDRLMSYGRYQVIIFGDQTILNEDVSKWPKCDILLSFYSTGFPLDKAAQYVMERKPYLVNSTRLQHLLFDRRIVLEMLDTLGIDTPRRVLAQRDGGPKLYKAAQDLIYSRYGVRLGEKLQGVYSKVEIVDEDTIKVDGVEMRKPFVEKPVDAEDHNIYIYYPKDQGGGVRKLFRKVGNKSSKYYSELSEIRQDGSYIYEEFIDTNNSVDVKAYILGNDHIYAETRKSPVVDGVVRRNAEGKEVRHKTTLSEKEVEMAKKINEGFGQKVCGFDLLRDNDRSMVMDVNGWSFVKGKNEYYDSAAFTLDKWFIDAMKNSWMSKFVRGSDMAEEDEPDYESQWTLKGIFSVCRHADRTPKQKIKYNIRSQKIMEYLKNGKNEVILKKEEELSRFLEIVKSELVNGTHDSHSDNNSLRAIQDILYRKMKLVGTKIQLKSNFSKKSGELVDVQVIIKWGGECTHAGLIQAQDLAETIKKDLKLLNPKLLDNIKLYKSSERRVAATVDVFHKVVCPQVVRIEQDPDAENYIRTCPEMLDDSSDAKPEMEIAKTHLRNYFNYRGPILTNPYATPDIDFMKTLKENNITFNSSLGENGCNNPREFIKSIGYLLNKLVGIMNRNFTLLSPEKIKEIQPEWCCYETPELFRERWIKMLEDFRFETMEDVIFEPTKIGELHDSLKYDALHNYRFLEKIFCPIDSYIESTSLSELSSSSYKNSGGSGSCGGGGGGEEWGWWREGGEERKKQGEKEIGGGGTAQLDGTQPTNGTVLHTNAVSKRTEMRRSISTGPVITHQSTRNARSMTKKTTVGSEEAKATDVGNTSINVTSNIYTGKMPHFGIIGGANSNGSEFEDELDHSNLSNSTAALMRNNGKRGSISLLLSSLNMDAEANKNKNENGRPNEDKRKKQHIALEDTIKEGAGNKSSASINSNENYPQMYQNDLRDLYFKTKILYNFVTPREFGISGHQKHVIGIKGSRLLLEKIVKNLEVMSLSKGKSLRPFSRFFFTKESHLYTLLNLVYEAKLTTNYLIPQSQISELDYLTHLTFEVYERKNEFGSPRVFSLRLGFSNGANCDNLLDMQFDSRHVLKVNKRVNFTDHIPLNHALNLFNSLLAAD